MTHRVLECGHTGKGGFAARERIGGFCATAGRSVQQTDTVSGEHDPDFRPGDVLHDGTVADRALWWHGMKLRDWPPTVESRQAELNEVSRMWAAWAENAITDTPPDIYKGERVGDDTAASVYFGGSTVALDNVWIVDGRFLTEREWSEWEHRDDPPHWPKWPLKGD